jgi:hypothetical protein
VNTPADHTTRASHSSSVPPVQETIYLSRPEGRIGYDVAGDGSLVLLVPGMGDLRAGYRFLAPDLRVARYRVACSPASPPAQSCASWNRSKAVPRAGRRAAVLPGMGWGYCS